MPSSPTVRGARLRPLAAALATALLLGACASPGADTRPLDALTPAQLALTTQPSPDIQPQWWRSLGDAQLDSLVAQALQGSPNLAVARARTQRAQALAQALHAANGPQATLGVDASRQRYTANGLVPPPVAGHWWNSASVQAGLAWSPDFFGQHAAEQASALGQAQAAQADAAAAETLLALQVARGYVALARTLAQQDLARRTLAQRQEIRDITHQRLGGLHHPIRQRL